ncbi:MAG: molecular chaperone HtpG [Clostridia bacterium]|nr:molecular chaperone HtpG [Clostridia bacterium]
MPEKINRGGISVDTEHIFPIIKKWLYSEKDIFLREIVSNATDAITKLKRLSSLGAYNETDDKYLITVSLDESEGTLTVTDNGIGMSEDELKKYICSIALSGAVDFIQKYESETDSSASSGIIGHFGLGFYSAFMVSSKVEIETKSYTDAPAVHWTCNEAGDYEISAGSRSERGTSIVMHISEEESEYLKASKIREMLNKYCAFMPVDIFFEEIGNESDSERKPINDTTPLWQKQPSECSKDEYIEFYHKVFNDMRDPLFYIHINADYPLNFKGILYFPRIANEYETLEGEIKLYYNQVFVADNIKEVIPEYLLMLKGVLDCPELPLNVSRSYLQTNTYVSKLSAHIVKKVADKLNSLALNDREEYAEIWKDIAPFIEYASIRDKKFYERVKQSILFELSDGSVLTSDEYLKTAPEENAKKVYYTTDKALQAQYISMLEAKNIKVVLFERAIDVQFASFAESCSDGIRFLRVDSNIDETLKGASDKIENEKLSNVFSSAIDKSVTLEFSSLADPAVPALLSVDEDIRRMEEMMRMYGIAQPTPPEKKLIVNLDSPLIQKLDSLCESDFDSASELAEYIYKLALLSQKKFTAEEMQNFMKSSYNILMKL